MKWTQSVLVLGVAIVAAGLVPVASRAAEFGRQYDLVAQASKPHSPVGQHPESSFSSTDRQTDLPAGREERQLEGWRVLISRRLLTDHAKATETAIELLSEQLREIVCVVPAAAVEKLKAVPLYLSPAYDGFAARAEYHPAAGWLRNHGRDPGMAKAVEFTNVLIFAAETRRMPNFALHELAHAYHDRELAEGYGNPTVIECFERAKAAGNYERVQRQDAKGRLTMDRAYALTNPQEYFAEVTESFFLGMTSSPSAEKSCSSTILRRVACCGNCGGVASHRQISPNCGSRQSRKPPALQQGIQGKNWQRGAGKERACSAS